MTGNQQTEPSSLLSLRAPGKRVSRPSNKPTPALWDPQLETQHSHKHRILGKNGRAGKKQTTNTENRARRAVGALLSAAPLARGNVCTPVQRAGPAARLLLRSHRVPSSGDVLQLLINGGPGMCQPHTESCRKGSVGDTAGPAPRTHLRVRRETRHGGARPGPRKAKYAGSPSAPGPLPLTLALPASSLRLRASSGASMRRPGRFAPAAPSRRQRNLGHGRPPAVAAPAAPRGAELRSHWPQLPTYRGRRPMGTNFLGRAPPTSAKWLLGYPGQAGASRRPRPLRGNHQ